MLKICNDLLADRDAVYYALRLAGRDTLERLMLMQQVGFSGETPFGYLTEVPFLRSVPPQVQVDLLAQTWRKLTRPEVAQGSLVDESVIYAACETAARLIAADRGTAERLLAGGPRRARLPAGPAAIHEIQAVHLDLSNEGNFLLISQFQDIPPDEARILKAKFGLPEADCEPMFDVLGRWHASAEFTGDAAGLLTSGEIRRAHELLIAAARGDVRRPDSAERVAE